MLQDIGLTLAAGQKLGVAALLGGSAPYLAYHQGLRGNFARVEVVRKK